MLRIGRKGGKDKFEFRGIDKSQVQAVVSNFLAQFGKEFADPSQAALDSRTADPTNTNPQQAYAAVRKIPASEFLIEWQDGNGNWDDTKPTDVIRVVD